MSGNNFAISPWTVFDRLRDWQSVTFSLTFWAPLTLRSLNVSKNESSFLLQAQSSEELKVEGLKADSKVYLFLIASKASKKNTNLKALML